MALITVHNNKIINPQAHKKHRGIKKGCSCERRELNKANKTKLGKITSLQLYHRITNQIFSVQKTWFKRQFLLSVVRVAVD